MSTDREVTRIVRSWLQDDEHESAERVLSNVLDRLDATPQRRPMWRAWRTHLMNNTLKFAAAGAVALIVAAVGLAIYFSRPSQPPATSPSAPPSASTTPTRAAVPPPTSSPTDQPPSTSQPTPTAAAARAPWVLFWVNTTDAPYGAPWLMRADGSQAHQIDTGFGTVGWSRDGTQLLDIRNGVVAVAEVGDEVGPFVDTGFRTLVETACHDKGREPFPCQDAAVAFSPNGDKIVFVQRCTWELPGCSFLTVIDMVTGERTELTDTLGPRVPVGDRRLRLELERPTWSADGSQIAFIRTSSRTDDDPGATSIYVINVDGTGLREIELGGLHAADAQWSPDGSEIAFIDTRFTDDSDYLPSDIWTVRPDGTGLTKRASGGDSPDWISASEIRFRDVSVDQPSTSFLVVNDSQQVSPYADLGPALAAAVPDGQVTQIGVPGDPGRRFKWQPAGDWRPVQ